MSAFLRVRLHLIWSTQHRQPQIAKPWQTNLYGYIHGICENIHTPLIKAGGTTDHIHLYLSLPATATIADTVRTIKSNSSLWIHQNHDPAFAWQTKYAAFSVSKSSEEDVLRYIENQEQHHHTKSFIQELEEFLVRHEIPYDPKYYLE